MLREILITKQRKNEPRRRWFYSNELELIVWLDSVIRMIQDFAVTPPTNSAPGAAAADHPRDR